MRSASVCPSTSSITSACRPSPSSNAMKVGDVLMVQRRQHLRLAPKAGEAIGIGGDRGQEHLERDLAIQPGIAGAIHLAHPSGPEPGEDLELTEASAGSKRHDGRSRANAWIVVRRWSPQRMRDSASGGNLAFNSSNQLSTTTRVGWRWFADILFSTIRNRPSAASVPRAYQMGRQTCQTASTVYQRERAIRTRGELAETFRGR